MQNKGMVSTFMVAVLFAASAHASESSSSSTPSVSDSLENLSDAVVAAAPGYYQSAKDRASTVWNHEYTNTAAKVGGLLFAGKLVRDTYRSVSASYSAKQEARRGGVKNLSVDVSASSASSSSSSSWTSLVPSLPRMFQPDSPRTKTRKLLDAKNAEYKKNVAAHEKAGKTVTESEQEVARLEKALAELEEEADAEASAKAAASSSSSASSSSTSSSSSPSLSSKAS